MKFSISREELLKALRVVSGVVERKHQQNQALANILFTLLATELEVVATDQEIELTAKVKVNKVVQEGKALIPCRKLNEICRVLPEGAEVVIDSKDEKILITAGKSRFVLSGMPVAQFPKASGFQEEQILVVPRIAFVRLIEKTSFAMAEQDVRYFLNGMLLEVGVNFLRTVAADGHRLAMQTMPFAGTEGEPCKIIIPRKGVLEILRVLAGEKAEHVSLVFGGTSFQVLCDEHSVTTNLIGGKFPDYEKVVPKRGDKVVRGQREILKEAIYRASALLSEKFKGVRLCFSKGAMKILAYNTEKDEVEEDLAIDFDGDEVELGFNAKYLLDFLSSGVGEQVKMTFSEPNGSVLLEEVDDRQGLCVVMPMRI